MFQFVNRRWGYVLLPAFLGVGLLILLAISIPAAATTVSFTAEADAYVLSSRPTSNRGIWSRLRTQVSPDQRSYVRFDVQGVTGTVNTAVLRLYIRSTNSAGLAVHAVADQLGRDHHHL